MPTTARKHFAEDLSRSKSVLDLGKRQEPTNPALAKDTYRLSVAMAIGALDAYFCDAYVDCLTSAMAAARAGRAEMPTLPKSYRKEWLPIGPLAAPYSRRQNWSLRMAARARMEKDNLLQVGRIKDMFNPVLPAGHKLWADIMPTYIGIGRKRFTKILPSDLAGLSGEPRSKKIDQARAAMFSRIGKIIQRRHDIVHNCDRPRQAIADMKHRSAEFMVRDVEDFVTTFDDHLQAKRIV